MNVWELKSGAEIDLFELESTSGSSNQHLGVQVVKVVVDDMESTVGISSRHLGALTDIW